MSPRKLIDEGTALLRAAEVSEPLENAAMLLAHVLGRPWLEVRLDRESDVPPEAESRYRALCARRAEGIPLQYLTGEQPFCGHSFRVDERVLIPRPETEELAERCLAWLRQCGSPAPRVLDLCCGSGCIGITLKLGCPDARVTCADISPDALAVTGENARRLGAEITLIQSNYLRDIPPQPYDLIVSNPPYIPTAVCGTLQREVLREPTLALDGGDDGLRAYRVIAAEAPAYLREGGALFLEIGSDQGDTVPSLLTPRFSRVRVHRDLQGMERMVEARR